ncbi:MinD/ParA family protein [Mycobacterium manitobense]|uniref:MinD/ParA family protein n=1 Tax=[Mycobacterium] manitobense TaxID=190147 RepID=A0A9X2YI87_9MYCO|nr:MinD/ParA family protein [[Mycobacterium] manitobense]
MALPPWQTPTAAVPRMFADATAAEAVDTQPESVPAPHTPTGYRPLPQANPPVPEPPTPASNPPPAWWLPPPPPGWPGPPPTGYVPQPGVLPVPPVPFPPPPPPLGSLPPRAFRTPPSLEEAVPAPGDRPSPRSGWRRTVHLLSGGHVNPGASRRQREYDALLARIRRPIAGDFRVAILSVKGGVGKTTTTLGLGSALAMTRSDRVIAVDANPDRGTLAERVRDTTNRSTVRDLISDPRISSYADVRGHTRMAFSRLEVLASEQDPAAADVFGEDEYRRTVDVLRRYYNVILTDCGTGIMHSAMTGVLDLAHSLVLVSSLALDAARSASATLDWLMQHGHSGLVRDAHVVLSASRPSAAAIKVDKVVEHFEARCASIHLVPFDPHLAEGADVDFALLKPATVRAYLELAGAVADNFSRLGG